MAAKKSPSRRPRGEKNKPAFRNQVDLEDALSVAAEYNTDAAKKFIRAFLFYLYKKQLLDLRQNSRLVENREGFRKWIVEPVIRDDEQLESTTLLAYYEKFCDSKNALFDEQKLDHVWGRSESFLQWATPMVLRSIAEPLLISSILDALGNSEKALEYLFDGITIGLQKEFGFEQETISKGKTDDTSSESPTKNPIWCLKFKDDYGGIGSLYYEFRPALQDIRKQTEQRFGESYSKFVEKHISDRNVNEEEASDIRRRRYKQREVIINVYSSIGESEFKQGLIPKLRAAISEHVVESVYKAAYEWNGLRFSDDKGESIVMKTNTSSLLNSILKQTAQRTRSRLHARGRGGARREREHFKSTRDQLAFAAKVNALQQPFRDNKSLWQYIFNYMSFEGYDSECLDSLKAKESLKHVPRHLLDEAFSSRKAFWENGLNIPPKLSPTAFALKHACHELGITDKLSYETLRRRYSEGQKQLVAIQKRQKAES